jgi:SAM-dependent methyltransferase
MSSAYHAAHLVADPARAVVWKAIAAHLQHWVPAHASVLELGAGYCDWINNVTAARRVAIDIWPELPRCAGPGVESLVLDLGSGLDILEPRSFDVVLASNLLEHFSPDTVSIVINAINRVLKPAGRLLVVQPNFRHAWRSYFDDYTHRSVFTDVSLPALLRAHGFSVDLVKARFLPYSMQGTRVPIREWLVTAYLRSPIKPMAGQMLVVASKR